MIIPEIKKILYATDLSQTARYCFRYAVCIASHHGAAITVFHVTETPTGYSHDTYDLSSYVGADKWEEILKSQEDETVAQMKARIAKFREDVAAEDASFSFKVDGFVVKSGNPVEEILLQAHSGDFDLVVMGAHGRGTLADAMMGSTARRVTRRAMIPVLVVRLPEADDQSQEEGLVIEKDLLDGKKILLVDDEPDVLESLEDLLPMCDLVKATTFEEAKALLEGTYFDMAVLDIMGVDGYKLLEIANQKDVIAVMLTARALSPNHVIKSFKEGAAFYIPKDEIADIGTFLNDVLDAREKGKHFWWRWLARIGNAYCEKRFGPDWKEKDKEFWEKFEYTTE